MLENYSSWVRIKNIKDKNSLKKTIRKRFQSGWIRVYMRLAEKEIQIFHSEDDYNNPFENANFTIRLATLKMSNVKKYKEKE